VCRSSKAIKVVANDDEDTDDSIESEVTYDRFMGTIEESDTLQVPTVTSGSDP